MKKPSLRKVVGVGIVLVIVGAGAATVAARSGSSDAYRTATASTQSVDQVLEAVGTIEPVSQASVAFPTSGTVSSTLADAGDTVAVGQPLARLDVEDLTVSLHEAQATLAQAELVLQRALDGEDVSSVASAGGTPQGAMGRSATGAAGSALDAAQRAVLDAQAAVDDAMATAEASLASAAQVCTTTGAPTTTTTTSTTTTTTPTSSTDDDGDVAGPGDTATCQQALEASLAAQRAVTAAQRDLESAMSDLNNLLGDLAGSATTSASTTTAPGRSGGSPAAGSTGAAAAGSGSGAAAGTASSPSAEQLVAYQKAVDAATLDVAVAEQALDQATIVSPIAGTVASVGLEVGDEVSAASSTQAVVVVADGGFEVTTKVSVTDLPDLEVGQAATVTPDGRHDPIEGEVVSIGVAPDSSSGTSTYAVTIGLTGDTSSLGNGSTASVAITTAASTDALAVPTSAVTVDGDTSSVRQLVDGEVEVREVATGAVGQTWTEITHGISEGDVVVLADLDEPLPGSATDTSSSSGGNGARRFTFPGGNGGGPPGGGGFRAGGN